MANRFWVGGTNTWNATAGTKWSTTSGGAGGSAVPTNADDVFLDGASGVVTVTIGATSVCKSINFTGFTGTLAGTSAFGLTVGNGTISTTTFVNTMSMTWLGALQFSGTGNLTTGGLTLTCAILVNNVGKTITLQDNLVCTNSATGSLRMFAGTLDANNKNVTLNDMNGGGSVGAKVINMGSGTWTFTGTGFVWLLPDPTNFTINAGTSTMKFTGSGSDIFFDGKGKTYYNFWNTVQGGICYIDDQNTFNNFKTDPGTTVFIEDGIAVTSLTALGTLGNTININSDFTGIITATSGTITVDYCTITNSTATGGATFNATHSIDGGGNNGWNFIIAPSIVPPTVTTQQISSISNTTAVGNGTVTDGGDATVTLRGVCYSQFPNPTTINNTVTTPGTTGVFSVSITRLTAGTLYYARAFATNAAGTSYGINVSFTTTNISIATKIDENDKPTLLAYNDTTGVVATLLVDPVFYSLEVFGVASDGNIPTALNRAKIDENDYPTLLGYNETSGLVEALRCGSGGELLITN